MKDMVISLIGKHAPTQKKKIERFFSACPNAEIELAKFLEMYKPFMQKESISIEIIVDAYIDLINQVVHSRLEFIRNGRYPAKSQDTALDEVYSNKSTMQQYMLGLALSYFLWKHHFQLLCFFREHVKKTGTNKQILEVGCGHGLFLVELLQSVSTETNVTVVDISLKSIEMTKSLLHAVMPHQLDNILFYHLNIFDFEAESAFDVITLGEVLEHVDNPLELLKHLASLLSDTGSIFITTCANCPAIDHVYHFKNIDDIKDIVAKAGLTIETELIAPSEDRDMHYLVKHQLDISFAAILKKQTTI